MTLSARYGYEALLWADFAAAAMHKPDVSIPEAATNADLMMEEFKKRFPIEQKGRKP